LFIKTINYFENNFLGGFFIQKNYTGQSSALYIKYSNIQTVNMAILLQKVGTYLSFIFLIKSIIYSFITSVKIFPVEELIKNNL